MKIWRSPAVDHIRARELSSELGVPLPVASVLVSRGLDSPAAARRFLNPRLSDLSDPFALAHMQKAVDRIWKAIENHETIAVYGDYDVDGVTGTALFLNVLRRLGARAEPFLPRRLDEGYGLTRNGLERCMRTCKPSLIVTVDCGTNVEQSFKPAADYCIDLIVTDHHEESGTSSDAMAVVNPKLSDAGDAADLAGVGVIFKLCHALIKHDRKNRDRSRCDLDLRDYLDQVAIGTIADVVPLTRENRILASHGLIRLNKAASTGLKALIDVAGIKNEIGSYEIGFMIGPRLNAAGRLNSAEHALNLLLSTDAAQARELATGLDTANRERKQVEELIVKEAIEELTQSFDPDLDFGIVVGKSGWHAGAIGIAAARICNRYYRPTAVIAFGRGETGRGSCRSIENFDIVAALKECSDLLDGFGGHQMAAGFTVKRANLDVLRSRFNEACAAKLKGQDLHPIQNVDAWIGMGEINEQLLAAIKKMRPFGVGNPAPIWGISHVTVVGKPQIIGNGQHVKFILASGATQLEAVGWRMADRAIPSGPVDVAFQLESNSYMGRTSLQLNIKDIRPSETQGDLPAPEKS